MALWLDLLWLYLGELVGAVACRAPAVGGLLALSATEDGHLAIVGIATVSRRGVAIVSIAIVSTAIVSTVTVSIGTSSATMKTE
jgi:hypothetical protein|tara:strand:+ start:525 stop:776 length:252 start_codon:yes stop_codon:yes gene_type:complete